MDLGYSGLLSPLRPFLSCSMTLVEFQLAGPASARVSILQVGVLSKRPNESIWFFDAEASFGVFYAVRASPK